jgi:hypothetical protein
MLRRSWPALLGLAACGLALLLFDWPMVGRALLGFDVAGFLLVAVPVTLVMFAARTLRWVAVAGLSFRPAALWRAHVQTALAIATAAATPLQAGEALKMKLARDATGAGWATLGAAFALERVADVAALLALGAIGLGLGAASGAWLALAAALAVAGVMAAPALLRWLAPRPWLPARFSGVLAPLAAYRPSAARMAVLGACTVVKWFCVTLLWQAVFAGAGVALGLGACALAVALVTFAVTASMVPGGIGVAELSTRAVLLWSGVPPGLADAAAVLLRLLTPLVVAIGLLHALALLPGRGAARHG